MIKFVHLIFPFTLLLLTACGTENLDISTISPTQTPKSESSERVVPSSKPAPAVVGTEFPREADADVVHVRAISDADGSWTFHVTIKHPDTGWDDYADGWDVVTQAGIVLKANPNDPFTRLLAHPHVDEQPFTRSQRGIIIPEDVFQVIVRAHDSVDGYGGQEIIIDLDNDSGEGYELDLR